MRGLMVDVPDDLYKDFKIKVTTKGKTIKAVILDFLAKYTYGPGGKNDGASKAQDSDRS